MWKHVSLFLMKTCNIFKKIKQPAYCVFKLYSNNDYVSDKTLVKQAIADKIAEDWNDRNCIAEQISNGEFNKIIFTQKRAGTSGYLKIIQETLEERGIESELIDFNEENTFYDFKDLIMPVLEAGLTKEEKMEIFIKDSFFPKFRSQSVTLWDNLDIAFSRIIKEGTEKKALSIKALSTICKSILYFRKYLCEYIVKNNSDNYSSKKIVVALRKRHKYSQFRKRHKYSQFGNFKELQTPLINITTEWQTKKELMGQGFFSEYINIIDKRFIYNTDRYVCNKTCSKWNTCDKKTGRFYARQIENRKPTRRLSKKLRDFAEIAEGNPFFVVGSISALGLNRKSIVKTESVSTDDIIKDYFKNIIWEYDVPKFLSKAYYNANRGKFYDFFEILPLYYADYLQCAKHKLSYAEFYNSSVNFLYKIITYCETQNSPKITQKEYDENTKGENYEAIVTCLIDNNILINKTKSDTKSDKKEKYFLMNEFIYYVFSDKKIKDTIKTYNNFKNNKKENEKTENVNG